MGLFDSFKKPAKPYKEESTNIIYDLLFCDDIGLYKRNNQQPGLYPWNILFSDTANVADLEKITTDINAESRTKILAYNRLLAIGEKPADKILLAVIVEVGLNNGLDVLASFSDGTARYINHTGKILIWETTDQQSNALTTQLFTASRVIVSQIGPWDKPRKPHPEKNNLRISFLVSDGLYFGEGPANALFNDPMAGPALRSATSLMQYLTETSLKAGK